MEDKVRLEQVTLWLEVRLAFEALSERYLFTAVHSAALKGLIPNPPDHLDYYSVDSASQSYETVTG